VFICGFGGPSSIPPIRRVAKNQKFVLYKRVHIDYKMYSITSRTPVPSSTTMKQCRAEAGAYKIEHSPHNDFLFKQQEDRRPKISHRWQIVLFHARRSAIATAASNHKSCARRWRFDGSAGRGVSTTRWRHRLN
jgi:hypothetical protein